jgi:hypothetical protein
LRSRLHVVDICASARVVGIDQETEDSGLGDELMQNADLLLK